MLHSSEVNSQRDFEANITYCLRSVYDAIHRLFWHHKLHYLLYQRECQVFVWKNSDTFE